MVREGLTTQVLIGYNACAQVRRFALQVENGLTSEIVKMPP